MRCLRGGRCLFTSGVLSADLSACGTRFNWTDSNKDMDVVQTTAPTTIRSPLARSIYNKMIEDRLEKQRDHSVWYRVNTEKLPDDLCESYIQSWEDDDTKLFLQNCYEKSDWFFTQLLHLLMKSVLSWFISNTTINGFLKRGSMFVFSQRQFEEVMHISADEKRTNLLDIGAGDGKVTCQMESHFSNIFATEVSPSMIWRLQERGYRVLDIDGWHGGERQYDVISCLNVLDRCDEPLSLLRNIHKSLVPGSGRLLIAIVLPFSPYIEYNKKNGHRPSEKITVAGVSFETQVASLVQDVFRPASFEVDGWTRLPYLCEGDLEHSFYYLNDVVFVLKPV